MANVTAEIIGKRSQLEGYEGSGASHRASKLIDGGDLSTDFSDNFFDCDFLAENLYVENLSNQAVEITYVDKKEIDDAELNGLITRSIVRAGEKRSFRNKREKLLAFKTASAATGDVWIELW